MKTDFLAALKQYFEKTPRSKVLEDWAKSESFDSIGPTIEDYIAQSQYFKAHSETPTSWENQVINNIENPKITSGFFLNTYLILCKKPPFLLKNTNLTR